MAQRHELTVGQEVWIRWGGTHEQLRITGFSAYEPDRLYLLCATGQQVVNRPLTAVYLTEAEAEARGA